MEKALLVDDINSFVMSELHEVMSVQLIVVIITLDSSIGLIMKEST